VTHFFSSPRCRLLLAFLLSMFLTGVGEGEHVASAAQAASAPIPGPMAVKPGARPDLAVFFAGEVMGWTEPCG